MIQPEDAIRVVESVISFVRRYSGAFLIGLAIAIGLLLLALSAFDRTPQQFLHWLAESEDPKVKTFSSHARLLKEHIEQTHDGVSNFEERTDINQTTLIEVLTGFTSDPGSARAYELSNRNQDIVRALYTLHLIAKDLLSDDKFNESGELITRNHKKLEEQFKVLWNIYEAHLDFYIHTDKTYHIALGKYRKARGELKGTFPPEIRDSLELELLRFMTYCAYRVRTPQITQEAIEWKKRAIELRDKEDPNPDQQEYRRKFFWIDLSALLIALDNGDKQGAETAFENLSGNTEYDFLLGRLKMHRNNLSVPTSIDRFIARLSVTTGPADFTPR